MVTREALIPVGYWRSQEEPDLPDPGLFVDSSWDADERALVLAHLRRAKVLAVSAGIAFCRFRCGVVVGSAEQSDGQFAWPDGLAHYLAEHDVRMPTLFVDHALGRAPALPDDGGGWWREQVGFGGHGRTFLTDGRGGRLLVSLAAGGAVDHAALRFVRALLPAPLREIRARLVARETFEVPLDYSDYARLTLPRSLVTRFEEPVRVAPTSRPPPDRPAPPTPYDVTRPIQVISDLAQVRRYVGMYVGDKGPDGMLHLVWEVLGNAVDLYLVGRCKNIDITILSDGAVRVTDDGPGLPVIDADGSPLLVRALTELHQAPTKDGHPIHVHLATFGLGLSVVHALSDRVEVATTWGGRRWVVSGGAGRLAGPPRDEGPASEGGTTVLFRPDPSLFPNASLDVASLTPRLREVAALCPGLTIRFSDERILVLREDEGVSSLLGVAPSVPAERGFHMGPQRPVVPLAGHASEAGMSVDVRLQWALEGGGRVRSFVNLAETRGGGSHVVGLQRALGALARALSLDQPDEVVRALGRYVVAVVSVFHFRPTFAGPTRNMLASPEIEPFVAGAVEACLVSFAETHPVEAKELVDWVMERDRRGW